MQEGPVQLLFRQVSVVRKLAGCGVSAVSIARDLAKPENPLNKRQRVLRCCSILWVASTSLTPLLPFLTPTDDGAAGSG
jgi:hypothetical protein